MTTLPYALAVIADSRSNPELNALISVCGQIDAFLTGRGADLTQPEYYVLSGVTVPVTGKGGLPDTAEVRISTVIHVLLTVNAATRTRIESQAPPIRGCTYLFWGRDATRAEVEAVIRAEAAQQNQQKLLMVDRQSVIPATAAQFEALFGAV